MGQQKNSLNKHSKDAKQVSKPTKTCRKTSQTVMMFAAESRRERDQECEGRRAHAAALSLAQVTKARGTNSIDTSLLRPKTPLITFYAVCCCLMVILSPNESAIPCPFERIRT